jgi:AraC-like DNA-binding protein
MAAREKVLVEGLDATRAAFNVEYESSSQFTREYKRLFVSRRCGMSKAWWPHHLLSR